MVEIGAALIVVDADLHRRDIAGQRVVGQCHEAGRRVVDDRGAGRRAGAANGRIGAAIIGEGDDLGIRARSRRERRHVSLRRVDRRRHAGIVAAATTAAAGGDRSEQGQIQKRTLRHGTSIPPRSRTCTRGSRPCERMNGKVEGSIPTVLLFALVRARGELGTTPHSRSQPSVRSTERFRARVSEHAARARDERSGRERTTR